MVENAEVVKEGENAAEDAENEKQIKMMEEMENGGEIGELDLTSEDWVNVNPTEITKRYDMIRRYVRMKNKI